MSERTRRFVWVSILMITFGALFSDVAEVSCQEKLDGFVLYEFYVYCGDSGLPSAPAFSYTDPRSGPEGRRNQGTHTFCVGKCGGRRVSLAEELAKLAPHAAAGLQAKVDEYQANVPAEKRLDCLSKGKEPKKCDTKGACEALVNAFSALNEAKADPRAAPTSYRKLKESLAPLLDIIGASLCENFGAQNRVDAARKFLNELTFAPGPADDANRSRLSEIEMRLTELQTYNCRTNQPAPSVCEAPKEDGPLFKSLVNGYTFFPFTESPQDLIPAQACPGCLWELVLADLTSHQVDEGMSPSGVGDAEITCSYRYLSAWHCPTNGIVITKRNYKKLLRPCASPQG